MRKAIKRGLLIGLLAALLLGCVPAQAENALEASIVLSAYAGEAKTVAIPEEIQGLPVVATGDGCFAESNVRDVTLPEMVEFIDAYAFWQCPLEVIHGMESVRHLGDGAFSDARIIDLYWGGRFCPVSQCLIFCAGSYAEAYAAENDIPHTQAEP